MDISEMNKLANRKRMNTDVEKLREKVSRENAKIIKLKVAQDTAYWDLKEKLQQVEGNHERLQQNMVEVQMQHEALSSRHQEELRRRPETLNKVTGTRSICSVLEEYSARLKASVERGRGDAAALTAAYEAGTRRVRDLAARAAAMQHDLRTTRTRLQHAHQTLAEKEEVVAAVRAEARRSAHDYEAQLRDATKVKADQEKEVSSLRAAANEAFELVHHHASTADALKGRERALAVELRDNDQALTAARAATSELAARLSTADAQKMQLETELNALAAEAERRAAAIEELTVVKRVAEDELAAAKRATEEVFVAAKRAAEEEIATAKREAEERLAAAKQVAEEQRAVANRAADELAAAKQAAEEELAATKRAAEELAASKQAAKEELAATKRAAEELAAAKQVAEEELAATKRAAEELAAAKQAAEEELGATKRAAEELAAAKQAAEEELAATKRAADELAAAKQAAEEEFAATKRAAEEELAAAKRAAEKELIAANRATEELAAAKQAAEEELAATKRAAEEERTAAKRAAQDQIDKIQNNFETYRRTGEAKIAELTERAANMDRSLEAAHSTIMQLMSDVRAGTAARAKLESTLAAQRRDHEQAQRQLAERADALAREKDGELAKQMTIISEYRGDNERLQERIAALRATIDNIQKELSGRAPAAAPAPAAERGPSPAGEREPAPAALAPPRAMPPPHIYDFLSDSSVDGDTLDAHEVRRRFEALSRAQRAGTPLPPCSQGMISLSQFKNELKMKNRKFFKNKRSENKGKTPK